MESKTITVNIDGMGCVERALKRIGDIVGSLFLIVVLSPVFIVLFVLQKMYNPGPALYSQERIGMGGRPFRIYKFRTMVVNAETDGVPMLEVENDVRLTKFGKLLRSRHIDELPQLWNVLVGDMSFVGYRPERRFFINQIMERNPDYELLFCTRPGVTSPATIKNGYTDTMEKMLRRLDMDLEYLRTRNLLIDLRVIIQTILSI